MSRGKTWFITNIYYTSRNCKIIIDMFDGKKIALYLDNLKDFKSVYVKISVSCQYFFILFVIKFFLMMPSLRMLKINPFRGHILIACFARSSRVWARLGRAIRSSRFAHRSVLSHFSHMMRMYKTIENQSWGICHFSILYSMKILNFATTKNSCFRWLWFYAKFQKIHFLFS